MMHWTVTALFLISLVAGLAAVYYACQVKLALARCQTGRSLVRWLTTPRAKSTNSQITAVEPGLDGLAFDRQASFNSNEYRPSITAAMILTSPPRMLIISVLCLVAGITEYLAVRFASNLGTLRGSKANLAVLVTVVGASVLMIVFHELFEWLKWFVEWKRNYTTRKRLKELAQTLPSHNSAAANDPGPSATSEAQPDKIGGANIDLAIGDEVLPQVNSTSEDRLVATIKELEKYEARRQEEFDRQLLLALQRILERRDGL